MAGDHSGRKPDGIRGHWPPINRSHVSPPNIAQRRVSPFHRRIHRHAYKNDAQPSLISLRHDVTATFSEFSLSLSLEKEASKKKKPPGIIPRWLSSFDGPRRPVHRPESGSSATHAFRHFHKAIKIVVPLRRTYAQPHSTSSSSTLCRFFSPCRAKVPAKYTRRICSPAPTPTPCTLLVSFIVVHSSMLFLSRSACSCILHAMP